MAAVKRSTRQGGGLQPGLPPVLDARTRLLILGSFPSETSLAAAQYYAHPRNHFWPLLGAVLGAPLPTLRYAHRLEVLRRHRVGLWDVIVRCRRAGSSDGAIRDATPGEIDVARKRAPMLAAVCFNGLTAARAEPAWRSAGFATLILPSSSPAFTRPFQEKLTAWRMIEPILRAVGCALNESGICA